ncbi:MAG: pilus assembly protein PilM [Candidatus Omnitrophota bacterium]
MDKENIQNTPETPENLVKDIFERPKAEPHKISAIFTHKKDSRKMISPSVKKKIAIPANVKPLPTSIDIGTSSIKVIRLGITEKRRFEVLCVDREPYGISGVPDSAIIKKTIDRIKKRNELGNVCISSLSTKDVQIYNMVFPPMSDEELKSAIQFKISQLKPFGLVRDHITFKFKKWDVKEGLSKAVQQKVLIVCVPNNVVSKHLALLKDSGFKSSGIEVPHSSLIHLGEGGLAYNFDEVILMVHIGEEESFFAVKKGRNLCFSKKIALSSKQIRDSISRQCRVSLEEAEELKKKYGLMFWSDRKETGEITGIDAKTDGAEAVYNAVMSLLENLVVEIEHSFKYFSYQITQSQINKFDRVLLSGGGANLKNLDKFLNVKLGVPVESFDLFTLFDVNDEIKLHRGELISEPATFAVCTGLALSQKVDKSQRFNFLPEQEKSLFRIFFDIFKYRFIQVAVLAIAAGTFIFNMQSQKVEDFRIKKELSLQEYEIAKKNISKIEIQDIDLSKEEGKYLSQLELLEAQIALISKGYRETVDLSVLMEEVAKLLPAAIWITELKYKDGKLGIVGSTANLVLITKFIEDLRQSDFFRDADFSYTKKDPDKQVYSFEVLTCGARKSNEKDKSEIEEEEIEDTEENETDESDI